MSWLFLICRAFKSKQSEKLLTQIKSENGKRKKTSIKRTLHYSNAKKFQFDVAFGAQITQSILLQSTYNLHICANLVN